MDNLTTDQRKLCMTKIKSKHTKPEMIARKALTKLGVKYRLHCSKLPGKPDIVIIKNKQAIFVNGCFWHQHENCKKQSIPKTNALYWVKKLTRNIDKQAKDVNSLKEQGWKIQIIWECQTKNEEELTKILMEFL